MKRIASLILALTAAGIVSAQTDLDALRYSQSSLAGTARYISMGGAFGALGADMSSISTNPAGLGIYRRSEFSFSPANSPHPGDRDSQKRRRAPLVV